MACGSIHQAQAGQSFTVKVTAGPKTVKGLLTFAGPHTTPGTRQLTDAGLRQGHTEPVVAGLSYHLTLRRSPHAGATTVAFTAPSGKTKTCTSEGPIIGLWIVFA